MSAVPPTCSAVASKIATPPMAAPVTLVSRCGRGSFGSGAATASAARPTTAASEAPRQSTYRVAMASRGIGAATSRTATATGFSRLEPSTASTSPVTNTAATAATVGPRSGAPFSDSFRTAANTATDP